MDIEETFSGFAFPMVTVKYAGPTNTRGSRWVGVATRDDVRVRKSVSYDYAVGGGAKGAIEGAWAA